MALRSIRESSVERCFTREVKKAGGLVRKIRYVGQRHATDRLVIWPGRIDFVELKRPGAKPRAGQAREHARLHARGASVWVIANKADMGFYLLARRAR